MDDQGEFVIRNLSEGPYALFVTPPAQDSIPQESNWAAVPLLVEVRRDSSENLVVLVQHPTSVTLHPVGDLASGLMFDVVTSGGLSCRTGSFEGSESQYVSLAPGEYIVRLKQQDRIIRAIPFTVTTESASVDVAP
jgi:hypothetical protein